MILSRRSQDPILLKNKIKNRILRANRREGNKLLAAFKKSKMDESGSLLDFLKVFNENIDEIEKFTVLNKEEALMLLYDALPPIWKLALINECENPA